MGAPRWPYMLCASWCSAMAFGDGGEAAGATMGKLLGEVVVVVVVLFLCVCIPWVCAGRPMDLSDAGRGVGATGNGDWGCRNGVRVVGRSTDRSLGGRRARPGLGAPLLLLLLALRACAAIRNAQAVMCRNAQACFCASV